MIIYFKRVKQVRKTTHGESIGIEDWLYFSISKTMFDSHILLRVKPETPEIQIKKHLSEKIKTQDIKLVRLSI